MQQRWLGVSSSPELSSSSAQVHCLFSSLATQMNQPQPGPGIGLGWACWGQGCKVSGQQLVVDSVPLCSLPQHPQPLHIAHDCDRQDWAGCHHHGALHPPLLQAQSIQAAIGKSTISRIAESSLANLFLLQGHECKHLMESL